MTAFTLTVNGRPLSADTTPRTHLADFLRESQGLTGTHIGCEHGVCGACTVEINGEISRACITYAVACDGAAVRTIEDFNDDALMARLRAAFTAEHALQCGYCTPGMLITARDLIRRRGKLNEPEIRIEMSGNLCRCTGYAGIVRAIARVMAEIGPEAQAAPPEAIPATRWLGPAPGLTASATHSPPSLQRQSSVRTPTAVAARTTQQSRPDIKVTTGPIRLDGGTTRLTQSVVIEQPIARVWIQLADLATVVPCMPGAALDGTPSADGKFTAHLALRLGPIRTTFAGQGVFSRDEGAKTCRIEGRGRDRSGPSSVQGEVVYRAIAVGETSTRVEADIGYSLAGPLAQFGRPALVHGLVTHIGATFARNLDAAAAGRAPPPTKSNDLGLITVLWGVLTSWLQRLTGRP
jgi:aerobic carbon-monoxide dehydrogenase small subunit